MTGKPLVSVIVPAYNIEKYVDACISSIIDQTYKNIEIIIVDDGSVDDSGRLSDEWEKRDHRIKVIHQENKGLSAARNAAMRICTGEYLIFVDGDDVISNDMIESLYQASQKTKADCIFCQYEIIGPNEKEFHSTKEIEDEGFVVNTEEAQLRLLNHIDIVSVVWNGFYKTALIKDLLFIEGKKNEDVMWRYLAIDRCKTIGYISYKLYGYRMREDSLMHQKFSLKDFDNLEGTVNRADYIMKHYENLRDTAITNIISDCTTYYIRSKKLLEGEEKKEALLRIRYYRKKYPVKFKKVMKAKNLSKGRKYLVALACISFPLASYVRFWFIDGGNKNLKR